MANVFRKIKNWMTKGMSGQEEGEESNFPKSLEGFGYKFNEDGELKSIKDNEPFVFRISDDHSYNQKRYEALGEVVTDYIYDLMEKENHLERIPIPIGAKPEEPQSFIFVSEGSLMKSKLLVLIHGSGAVRAGQWTRKLIINNNINIGSQLPYIRQGIKQGYGIIVLNTNLNTVGKGRNEIPIPGNQDPESHGEYVFKNFVMKSKASCIAVVAHSYGGIVTQELVTQFLDFFKKRVFALAFTDSVHSFRRMSLGNKETLDFFKERGCNFAASYAPKNTPQNEGYDDCPAVSAGTDKHEWTSHTSFDILFDFLSERLNGWVKSKDLKDMRTYHKILHKPGDSDEGEKIATGPKKESSLELDSENIDQQSLICTENANQKKEDSADVISQPQEVYDGKMSVLQDNEAHASCRLNDARKVEISGLRWESNDMETEYVKCNEKTELIAKAGTTKNEKVEGTKYESPVDEEKAKGKSSVDTDKTKEETVIDREKTKDESTVDGKKTKEESMIDKEKTKDESTVDGKKTKDESTVDGKKTKDESTVDGEKTKDEFTVDGEKTKDEFTVDGKKTKDESTVDGEKTKDEATVDGEKTKDESTMDGEKTKDESTVDEEKTKDEFTVDGEKTKDESTVDGEKTKDESTVDGEKTKDESTVDGEKTKDESTVDGEKTKDESTVDGEKTKDESTVDGEKTKDESTVDGEKTKVGGDGTETETSKDADNQPSLSQSSETAADCSKKN